MIIMKLLLTFCLFLGVFSLYSKSYRKCKLFSEGISVGELEIEKVTIHKLPTQDKFRTDIFLKPTFEDLDFIIVSYLTYGGSGEVFLVEEIGTKKRKILKRFLKEEEALFATQNFILKTIGHEANWHHLDNSTMISFEDTKAKDITNVFPQNISSANSFLYEASRELQGYHRINLVHHDIKNLNILVEDMKYSKIIDWNLGFFYYSGIESRIHGGTFGFFPPEVILSSSYPTPAVDVWSFGITIYRFFARHLPHPIGMQEEGRSELWGIVALVGSQELLKYVNKYKIIVTTEQQYSLLEKIKKDPKFYSGVSLRDRVVKGREVFFTDDLVDLLQKMLKFDPEERITMAEVVNHPFFDKVKKLPKVGHFKFNMRKQRNKQDRIVPADNLRVPVVEEMKGGKRKEKMYL